MKYTVPAYRRSDVPSDRIPGGFFMSEMKLKRFEEMGGKTIWNFSTVQ